MERKRLTALLLAAAVASQAAGCQNASSGQSGKDENQNEGKPTIEVVGTYEAEAAQLNGKVKASEASEPGYVSGFENDDDSCTFQVAIETEGFYDLHFISAAEGGYKENYVLVDGNSVGTIAAESETFADSVISRVYLTPGAHDIAVSKYWGWIKLDKLVVQTSEPIDERIYQVSSELVNKNATDEAKRLMRYLADTYGKNVLSGQYCDQGQFGKEMAVIKKATGKYPAVLGLDFIEYSPSRAATGLWDFVPVPGTVKEDGTVDRSTGCTGLASIIMANTAYPQECWEFLKWWTSADVQTQYGREMESLMGSAARVPTANLEAFENMPWPVDDFRAPHFMFTHQSSSAIKDTGLNRFYSTGYDNWKDDAVGIYNAVNDALKPVSSAHIINHEILENDIRVITYDNGVKIYINKSTSDRNVDGVEVPAKSYQLGGDKNE